MHPLSSDWRLRLAIAAGVATGAALLSAWLTPRGPVTTPQSLISMAAALLIGMICGLVMRSRWSTLLVPAVYIAVFELARLGADGPTVDGIHLGSTYGVIAFVVGRLAHGLLVLMPMAVGAIYGIWLAGRLQPGTAPAIGLIGWTLTGLATLALAGVALAIARPATTAPIVSAVGEQLPNSIAELRTIRIGGHDQALMLRGRSRDNPVLLYLAGGPGGTDLGALRSDVGLEQYFVVAAWEQRGAGKSYPALEPLETLTVEQMVADTIAVTNYLREEFSEEKIYLVGNSWGSTLGVLAVQQRPELFHAYIGVGQMVSQRETDRMFYEDTLAWAERTGNNELAATLRRTGPPPYENLLNYEPSNMYEHEWNAYPELDLSNEMPAILFVPEYSWVERFNAFRGFLDSAFALYPQLQDIDFRIDVPRLEVPVYVVLGEHEARGRAELAKEWFAILEAPSKELIFLEGAGHRALFDQPAAFTTLMVRAAKQTGRAD